jgi:CRP-like cAMP-binding protein
MTVSSREFPETRKAQLFDGLSETNLQKILSFSVIREYKPMKLLVQQGDMPEAMYLLLEGNIKTLRFNENGEEATIRMLGAGDTCMEAVLFMGGPSPISAQTLTNCRILMIPAGIVRLHVLEDAQFALNIIRIVTRHYKNAMHQIDAMSIKSSLQRVGYYFLTKHLESGHDNLEFTLPFKKQTIASYLGMTPETFSRTLKQMKSMGIDVGDDFIRMKDAFSLCHFCDSDTAALCSRHDQVDCKSCPLHS